jgi:hypothetical protein
MKRSTLYASAAAVCLAVACSSSSDSAPAAYSPGGASSDGGSTHIPGGTQPAGSGGLAEAAGTSSDGGAAGEAGAAGTAGTAGEGGLEQGVVVVVPPSTCSEAADWSAATPLAGVSTTDDEKLLSITADELDVAFLRNGALLHAHRSTAKGAFDAGSAVTVPDGYDPTAGAALSGDGKTLVLVASDGHGLAALTRAARTDDFDPTADPSAFVALNERAVQTQEHYAQPVLAPDGSSLVFVSFTPGIADNPAVVYESVLSGNIWAMPNSISHYIFDGTTDKRPLPSALSSDSRTLFYYDEATAKQVARFRDRPDAPLYDVVDLGGRTGAVPNSSCQRIYYTSNGDVLTEAD